MGLRRFIKRYDSLVANRSSKRLPSLWAGVCAFMGLLQLLSDVFKAIMGMAFALCSRRKVLTYENSIY